MVLEIDPSIGSLIGKIIGKAFSYVLIIFLIFYAYKKFTNKPLDKTTKMLGRSSAIILFFFGIVCLLVIVMIIAVRPNWSSLQILAFTVLIALSLLSFLLGVYVLYTIHKGNKVTRTK